MLVSTPASTRTSISVRCIAVGVVVCLLAGVATPAEPKAATLAVKKPAPLTEDVLKQKLLDVPEFSMLSVDYLRKWQLNYAKARISNTAKVNPRDSYEESCIAESLQRLLREAQDAGLPVRNDASCTLSPKAAETLGRCAADLCWPPRSVKITGHSTLMTADLDREPTGNVSIVLPKKGKRLVSELGMPRSALRPVEELRKLFEVTWRDEKIEKTFNVVPVLVQVLQVEDKDYRQLLVEELTRIAGPEASKALAQRALYDLSPEIREAACTALKKRPADEFRDVLLAAFDYPWPPAADHAAQVLIETKDVRAIPALAKMLDQRDPAAPFWDEKTKRLKVRELVRLNHTHNCCLCHAPSYNLLDWGLARVMESDRSDREYYDFKSKNDAFIRADVTYLRPDFSVILPVERPRARPLMQRYDFVVRTRRATFEEEERDTRRPTGANYPQREAMLVALRGLSGKDFGTNAESWRKFATEMPVK